MDLRPLSKSVFQLAQSLLNEDGTPVERILSTELEARSGLPVRTFYWAAAELAREGVIKRQRAFIVIIDADHWVFAAVRGSVAS